MNKKRKEEGRIVLDILMQRQRTCNQAPNIHLQVVLTTFGDKKKTNGVVHLVSTWISLKSMIIEEAFSVIEIFIFPKSKLFLTNQTCL
jgi:hypothetical protein